MPLLIFVHSKGRSEMGGLVFDLSSPGPAKHASENCCFLHTFGGGTEPVYFPNDLKLSANMYALTIKIQHGKASGSQSAKLELTRSSSANR